MRLMQGPRARIYVEEVKVEVVADSRTEDFAPDGVFDPAVGTSGVDGEFA